MRNLQLIFLLFTSVFAMQSVFAEEQDMASSDSKPCAMVARACVAAGFTERKSTDKKFWQDCMKPILLGNTVQHVTVDSETVKSCRSNKIDRLKKELDALEKVSS